METTLQLEAKVQTPQQLEKVTQYFAKIAALGCPTTMNTVGKPARSARGAAEPAAARPVRTRTSPSAGRVTRPAARAGNGHVSDEQMLAAIEGKDGITARQLAAELSVSDSVALRKLKAWEKDGKVTRTGERAQRRWHSKTASMAA